METNILDKDVLSDKCFSEEELIDLGIEYTSQNFSKYLIFRKDNQYYLMDEVKQNQFKVQFNFSDNN